jgi:hypothetical protein
MSAIAFLLDECVPEYLADEVIRLEPAIEVNQVGLGGAPEKGTKDPELLRYVEAQGLTLVTMDKRTFPRHLANHFATGGHTWGVLPLRQDLPVTQYAEDLVLIWSSYEKDEMRDSMMYLPL